VAGVEPGLFHRRAENPDAARLSARAFST